MTKYIFKIDAKGTGNNPNFAGVETTCYAGKCYLNNINRAFDITGLKALDIISRCKYLARHYGYSSFEAAKRYLDKIIESHNEETTRWNHHRFNCQIISIEV